MTLIRHLVAIAALPFVVSVLVPAWLARRSGLSLTVGGSTTHAALQVAGVALLLLGLTLFTTSLRRFAVDGKGTLAPWDPPRMLVVRGPYRYVRNPMISGVAFVLFGEASILGSIAHLWWAIAFLAINAVYISLLEEPLLAARFAASYDDYRRNVPRLVPRVRPWDPPRDEGSA